MSTFLWRRVWDSNPRGAYTPDGLVDRCFQPLSQLSISPKDFHNTYQTSQMLYSYVLDELLGHHNLPIQIHH